MKPPFIHIICASILCIIVAVGYGFLYSTISAKSARVAETERQIAAQTDLMTRIVSARTSLSEIAGDETAMRSYFISDSDVVDFITYLKTQGQTLGTTVTVRSVSPSSTGSRPLVTFALSVRGTFDAVMRTVGAIEYAPYDLSVSTLSVGHDEKNSWHADFTILVGSVSSGAATGTP